MDAETRPATTASGPVFDPFDPRWSADPYPLYAELREHAPAHRSPAGFWVFTRHADCQAVLRHRAASVDESTVDPSRLSDRFRRPDVSDDELARALTEARPFLFRDPPDHTRLRGLVAKAFTPKVVESLRCPTQRLVDDLLDRAVRDGEVDLVEAFAHPQQPPGLRVRPAPLPGGTARPDGGAAGHRHPGPPVPQPGTGRGGHLPRHRGAAGAERPAGPPGALRSAGSRQPVMAGSIMSRPATRAAAPSLSSTP